MTVWRYEAIPLISDVAVRADPAERSAEWSTGLRRRGELSAATEAEARASLRRIGLQPVVMRPMRHDGSRTVTAALGSGRLAAAWRARQRRLRRGARAQLLDSLGMMVDSGVPLTEAVETLVITRRHRRSRAERHMLLQMRESLRGGAALAGAMRVHPGWFDPVEVAMVEAGQHGGMLPDVLASLAERHEEDARLGQRLVGALLYPAVVGFAGAAVALFLSVHTLPELARVLVDADVEVPALTSWLIVIGDGVVRWAWLAALAIAGFSCAALAAVAAPSRWGSTIRLPRMAPRVLRTIAVADSAKRIAELIRCGVPMTDALRVVAPTARRGLRDHLIAAAVRVERGDDLAAALCDGRWFDEEFRRLVEVAQSGGDLDVMLHRLGDRHHREARRLIDRVAALIEPVLIILLAGMVGCVVLAAVLPLLRLKEIL